MFVFTDGLSLTRCIYYDIFHHVVLKISQKQFLF